MEGDLKEPFTLWGIGASSKPRYYPFKLLGLDA